MIARTRAARRIITVAAGKGGVGKSFLATNLAVVSAQAGQRVLLVDGDLGSPNLHTLLGVSQVSPGLDGFLAHGGTLEATAIPTQVPGLSLVAGAFQGDAANLGAPGRRRLVDAVQAADADVVVVDVGAGTGAATIDLFLAADHRVLVMVPQLPAMQNAYLFLKAAVLELLRQVAEAAGESAALAEALPSRVGKLTPALATLRAMHPRLGARSAAALAAHGVVIVGNQVVDAADTAMIEGMRRMIRDYLALTPAVLGTLRASPAARASVADRLPVVLDAGAGRLGGELRSIAKSLLAIDVEELRAARAFPGDPASPGEARARVV